MKFKNLLPFAVVFVCIFPWGCDKELPEPNNNGNNNGNNNTTDTIYFTVEGIKLSNGVVKDTMHNSAKIVGDFSSIANTTNPIIEHGHVWSKTTNLPVLGNAEGFSSLGAKSSPGIFTSNLAGLTPNSVYYARAYVTTQQGTAYHPKFVQFKTKLNPTPNLVFGQFSITSDPNNSNSANPGETLTIEVSVLNSGLVDAKGVTAQFIPSTGIQVLTSQPIAFGDIFAGANISKSISIKVDQSVQWNTLIPITINLKDNSNTQWMLSFNITVKSPYAVSDNLLLYYDFEDQATFNLGQIKDLTNNTNGAVIGSVSLSADSPSGVGKSINFPGNITSAIKIPVDVLADAIEFSIALWIKTGDSDGVIFDGDTGSKCCGGGYPQTNIAMKTHGVYLFTYGNDSNYSINQKLLNNTWHHLAITKDSQKSIKIYIDGQIFDTVTFSPGWGGDDAIFSSTAYLGVDWYGSLGYQSALLGKIDNFRMYNRVISLNEVSQIFNSKQ